jgi:hypothetical protein
MKRNCIAISELLSNVNISYFTLMRERKERKVNKRLSKNLKKLLVRTDLTVELSERKGRRKSHHHEIQVNV